MVLESMSAAREFPKGCMGCNPEEIKPLLEARGIHVEAVPGTPAASKDILVCGQCGQAWLLMPREGDPKTPVA